MRPRDLLSIKKKRPSLQGASSVRTTHAAREGSSTQQVGTTPSDSMSSEPILRNALPRLAGTSADLGRKNSPHSTSIQYILHMHTRQVIQLSRLRSTSPESMGSRPILRDVLREIHVGIRNFNTYTTNKRFCILQRRDQLGSCCLDSCPNCRVSSDQKSCSYVDAAC